MIVLGQGETDPLSVLSVREHTLKSYLIQLSHPGKATWKGEPIRESRGSRWKLPARGGLKQQPTATGGPPNHRALSTIDRRPAWHLDNDLGCPLTPPRPALP